MIHPTVELDPQALTEEVSRNIEQANVSVLLAGFPKCGTTSFAHWLDSSPRISVSNPKETFLLCREHRRTGRIAPEGELAKCFTNRDASIRLEASTLNAYSEILLEVVRSMPQLKVILAFRDPVESVFSWHNQVLQAGEAVDPRFERCWELSVAEHADPSSVDLTLMQNYATVCKFGFWIGKWAEAIGHDRLLIVDAKELSQSSPALKKRLEAFLGADLSLPDSVPVLNSYAAIRFEPLYKRLKTSGLNKTLRDFERRFPALSSLRRNAKERLFRRQASKGYDESLREQLAAFFADDVRACHQLFDTNKLRWSSEG